MSEPAPQPSPPAPTPSTPPAPDPTPPTPPAPPAPTALSGLTPEQQAEVTRLMAAEKDQGRRAAERAIAEQLGCSPEEAKAALEAKRAAELAAMDEATRKLTEANEAKAAAEAIQAAATAKLREASVRSALVAAGVRADRLVDAQVLLTNPAAGLATDADDAAITAAAEAFKATHAEWFGPAAPTPTPPAPTGLPGGGTPRPAPAQGGLARGAEIAQEHFGLAKQTA